MADGRKINDNVLWKQDYFRQLHGIKGALRSLKLQSDRQRETRGNTASAKLMAHTFAMVDAAFEALNTPEPKPASDDYLPTGRRQFISDLKARQ